MPNQTPNQSSIRSSGHRVRGYVSVMSGRVLATATIISSNFNNDTGRYSQLTLDDYVGIDGVELWDCRIQFFDSVTGLSKGFSRISREITPTDTVIAIPETSLANLDLNFNDTLEIYDSVHIQPRIPSDTGEFAPDNQPYTDQNSNIAPITNSGLGQAKFVDRDIDGDELDYATFDFIGDNSYSLDPNSDDTNLIHFWIFGDDCTPSDSTDANPTGVEIPVGTRWIYHAVVDTGAGSSFSHQRIPIAVHDSANPPLDVALSSVSGTVNNGWQTSFNVGYKQTTTLAAIPDGSAILFWLDEQPESYGAMVGDSAVKLFGYMIEDSEDSEFARTNTSFTVLSPLALLTRITGFSQAFINSDSPDDWQHLQGLSINSAVIQILRYYTTVLTVCDTIKPTYDLAYPAFYIQKQSPISQARELVDAMDSRITMDRRGLLLIYVEPDLLPLDLRPAITKTLTLTQNDIIDIAITRPHRKLVDTVQLRGIDQTTFEGYYAIYPSTATNEGTNSETIDRLIVFSQDDLNIRGGRRGARIDRVYIATGGVQYIAPTVELTLNGSYDVFDFYEEYVILDTPSARGIDLDVFLFHIISINISYGNGTATTNLVLQAATHAPPAEPQDPPTPPPTYVPLDIQVEIPSDEGIPIPPNAPPDTPTAIDDDYDTDINTELDIPAPGILANDIDPSGLGMIAELVKDVEHGSLVLADGGGFVYNPDTNFVGTDTFIYRVFNTIAYSNNANVSIGVSGEATCDYDADLTIAKTDWNSRVFSSCPPGKAGHNIGSGVWVTWNPNLLGNFRLAYILIPTENICRYLTGVTFYYNNYNSASGGDGDVRFQIFTSDDDFNLNEFIISSNNITFPGNTNQTGEIFTLDDFGAIDLQSGTYATDYLTLYINNNISNFGESFGCTDNFRQSLITRVVVHTTDDAP